VNGFTGQFSMGHAGFMAVGAYTSAFITFSAVQSSMAPTFAESTVGGNMLFFAATILGGLAAGAAGLIVGLPSLRLAGDYLAIVTLGFGEIIKVMIMNTDAVSGALGLSGIPEHAGFH